MVSAISCIASKVSQGIFQDYKAQKHEYELYKTLAREENPFKVNENKRTCNRDSKLDLSAISNYDSLLHERNICI